jgi:hypothetical protein
VGLSIEITFVYPASRREVKISIITFDKYTWMSYADERYVMVIPRFFCQISSMQKSDMPTGNLGIIYALRMRLPESDSHFVTTRYLSQIFSGGLHRLLHIEPQMPGRGCIGYVDNCGMAWYRPVYR